MALRFLIILGVLLSIKNIGFGQTRIAVPTTTVQFDELKFSKKEQRNVDKRLRFNRKQIKYLKKSIHENTDLDQGRIDDYDLLFQSMDSAELSLFRSELDDLLKNEAVRLSSENEQLQQLAQWEVDTSIVGDVRNYYQRIDQLDSTGTDSLLNVSVIDSTDLAHQDSLLKFQGKKAFRDYQDSVLLSRYRKDIDTTSISSIIGERLEELMARKVRENGFNELGASVEPEQLVKQYIPSIEKFDHIKPEIPDEKLAEAVVDQYKQRKLQELRDAFKVKQAENFGQKQGVMSKFSFGGYARYDATKQSVELTPTIGFGLAKRILIGGGYQTNISLNGSDSLNTSAIRAFTNLYVYHSFFVHLESEWARRNHTNEMNQAIRERNTYLGVGRTFQYRFVKTSLMVLYNFNAPSQLRPRKFSIRLGISISK